MDWDEYEPMRTRAKRLLQRGNRAPPTRWGVMVWSYVVVSGAAAFFNASGCRLLVGVYRVADKELQLRKLPLTQASSARSCRQRLCRAERRQLDERGRGNILFCASLWSRLMRLIVVLQCRPFPLGVCIVPRLPRLLFIACVARIVSRQETFAAEKTAQGLRTERGYLWNKDVLELEKLRIYCSMLCTMP